MVIQQLSFTAPQQPKKEIKKIMTPVEIIKADVDIYPPLSKKV